MQMQYCIQVLDWLRQRCAHLDQAECQFILEGMGAEGRRRSSGKYVRKASSSMYRTRSDAMLSVMRSGLSLADSSLGATQTMQRTALQQSGGSNKVVPVPHPQHDR